MIVARINKVKRLCRIRIKQLAQLFSSILITIAVYAIKFTTVNMDNLLTQGKRLVIVYIREIEEYNRQFLFHKRKSFGNNSAIGTNDL